MTDMTDREMPIGEPLPHLTQMFTPGKLKTIVYPGKPEVEIWVARPNSKQTQSAQRHARVERARRFRELTADDSEESMALDVQIGEFTKSEIVDNILSRDQRQREQQAYNEVLYSEDYGSDWGKDGATYLELLDAVITRMEEIQDHNIEMEAAENPDGLIQPVEDEELVRLQKEQSVFEKEVMERTDVLTKDARSDISVLGIDTLRRDLRKAMVEGECDIVWFGDFRGQMVWYAIRYPDKHGKLYFEKPGHIDDLPDSVQSQLFAAYEDVDMGSEQTKNLLTPLPS